jgi:phage gpG-like protein
MATMTIEEFRDRLKEAVRTGAMGEAILETGHTLAFIMERGAKGRTTAGNPLNVRSGKLRQSIKPSVREIRGGVRAGIQAGSKLVPYAAMHETGKTRDGRNVITPKKGKFLRIPFPNGPATTKTGRDRFMSAIMQGGEAHDVFDFVPLSGDRGMLVHKFSGEPWYLLLKSVKIRKRPFLEPSRKDAAKRLPRLLGLKVRKALRTVNLGT